MIRMGDECGGLPEQGNDANESKCGCDPNQILLTWLFEKDKDGKPDALKFHLVSSKGCVTPHGVGVLTAKMTSNVLIGATVVVKPDGQIELLKAKP
jgi:hypothetical protein